MHSSSLLVLAVVGLCPRSSVAAARTWTTRLLSPWEALSFARPCTWLLPVSAQTLCGSCPLIQLLGIHLGTQNINFDSAYPMTDPCMRCCYIYIYMVLHGFTIKINPHIMLALIYQHHGSGKWVWMPMGDYNAPFREMPRCHFAAKLEAFTDDGLSAVSVAAVTWRRNTCSVWLKTLNRSCNTCIMLFYVILTWHYTILYLYIYRL